VTAGPLVLGIETSCDETGVGIVRGATLLADAVASSVEEHARFGGVVPEVASRAHLEAMVPTIERACREAGVRLDDLDAIAVTAGPGLAGALLVGVAAAKSLAVALGKPLYGVNHLAAHVAVDIVEHGPLVEPTMAMLVSGGHSSLLLVPDVTNDVRSLGSTIDDAAGEAFDKAAKLLGLGYPGGPAIEELAKTGDPNAVPLPRPLVGSPESHFSFAGLKSAVQRAVAAGEHRPEDIAASFQQAVVDCLVDRTAIALGNSDAATLVVAGGVAANSAIRRALAELAAREGRRFSVPPPWLCTDNAAMIAWAGAERLADGLVDSLDAPARARWPLDPAAEKVRGAGVKA